MRGMKKKTKKDKVENKTIKNKKKKDHKMQTRRPLSLVTKKQQHRSKILQMNSLKWKETTQERTNKNKNIKHNTKLPF